MNKVQWWIACLIVFCSFLQGCANRNMLYTPDWWDQRNEAEAIIYKYYSVGGFGESTYYSYKVNDSIYEDYMSSGYCSMVPDPVKAKYMVAYNPANPQENKFLWHKPIFENHQQLRYEFDSIPQRFHRKNFHVKDTVVFEKNERLVKTIGIMGAARHVYLGNDSIISVTCHMKVPWGYLEYLSYRELNYGTYDPDSISGKSFVVEYDPKNALRIRVLFDKPLIEKRNYRLEFIDVDDKTEDRLNKAAREVGEGGVIYWSPRNDRTPDMYLTAEMNDFLRTYRPRDKKGKKLDVEIKVVEYDKLDKLFE